MAFDLGGLFSNDGATTDFASQLASGGLTVGLSWLNDRFGPSAPAQTVPTPTVIAVQNPPRNGDPVDYSNINRPNSGTLFGMQPQTLALVAIGAVVVLGGGLYLLRK